MDKSQIDEIERIFNSITQEQQSMKKSINELGEYFVKYTPRKKLKFTAGSTSYKFSLSFEADTFKENIQMHLREGQRNVSRIQEGYLRAQKNGNKTSADLAQANYQEIEQENASLQLLLDQVEEEGLCSVLKSLLDNIDQSIHKISNLDDIIRPALDHEDYDYGEHKTSWLASKGLEVKPIQDFMD